MCGAGLCVYVAMCGAGLCVYVAMCGAGLCVYVAMCGAGLCVHLLSLTKTSLSLKATVTSDPLLKLCNISLKGERT
jgi:hypothetical protein